MLEYLKTTTIAGNELWRPLALFGALLAGLVIAKIGQTMLHQSADRLRKRNRSISGTALDALGKSLLFVGFAVGLKLGIQFIEMGEGIAGAAKDATSVVIALAVGWVAYCMVEAIDAWMTHFASKTASKMDDMLVPMVRKSLRVTIVVLILVQVAQLLSDKPITSIIAGLGIGGLAFALAAQDSLKNLFGSLVILADKPFELGDRVVIDGHDGPVEEVGFRSTKIRTLEGHLVTVPNGELANKTILNIGRRPHIRRLADITITYDTPPEKVQRAIDIIKELLDNHEGMHPDFPPRVYFNNFNDASLNILVLYWYHPPDYWAFMQFGEWFNMELLKRYNDEGIEFAFPTQTLYLAGDEKRPLNVGGLSQS